MDAPGKPYLNDRSPWETIAEDSLRTADLDATVNPICGDIVLQYRVRIYNNNKYIIYTSMIISSNSSEISLQSRVPSISVIKIRSDSRCLDY